MPELPEVAALADVLNERAVGRVVVKVWPAAFSVLKTYDPPVDALSGLEVEAVSRHGKFLDLTIGGLHLVFHLSRAGWLRWKDDQPALPPKPGKGPLALRVILDDPDLPTSPGFDLTEAGTQKRLAMYVVKDPSEVPGVARLGIDPLSDDLTLEVLQHLLDGAGRAQIKGVLTDQSILAGVGNAYSDEILWAAKLSPFKPASNLTPEEVATLHEALVTTLRQAVESARGLAASELKAEKKAGLNVHAQTGKPCPRCGDTVREVSFADKSLQYCATCQTGGKPLADRRLSRLLK
ncbi:MAG TPA: DNA-formamidopyrimidine glycosylase family protein [Mycobacteriales bacterium]|nr:DNA-formamidopyrimidine glycosylase family protein [Mycobacteriales bacterium]